MNMKTTRSIFPALFAGLACLSIAFLATAQQADAHCQVPCGIYGDDARLVEMAEHVTTITKAAAQITELAGKQDAQSLQQVARWVANKESHAQEIQEICLNYFLAQRIKAPAAGADKASYYSHLEMLHAIITASMKCKQSVDAGNCEKLHVAVDAFAAAYSKK